MPSSNPYTTAKIGGKRRWVAGALGLATLSIGGAFGINALLNPTLATANVSGDPVSIDMTVRGDAVPYQYGVIELEVVRTGGKISAVNLIQAGTSGAEWAVVPSMLVEATIQAQGSGFGNISGATFTTEAYKQALNSAISKLS